MSMLWLGGRQANALETANAVSANPAAAGSTPETALYDRHPDRVFRFGSLTAAPHVEVDLDMIDNSGDFENGVGFPVGWTTENTGTGAVTQEVNPAHVANGSASALLETPGGAGVASLYRDVVVRSGATTLVESWIQSDGTSVISGFIRNQETGNYWTGTAWTATPTAWCSASTAVAIARKSSAIAVESLAAVGSAVTTLRFQFINQTASSEAWVDYVVIVPNVTFASIHGHNIDPRSVPKVRYSTDGFVASDVLVATMTPLQPAFYSAFASVYAGGNAAVPRFWRVKFTDTNGATSGPIYMGEFVLGEHVTYRGPALPLQANYSDQQVRVPHRFGAPAVFGMGSHELRSYPLTIRCESTTERDAFFNEWRRTLGGYPVIVVPHDGTGHTDVIYGLMDDSLPHSWATRNFVTVSTQVDEMPHPLILG